MLKLTHTRAVFLMVVVTLLWSIAGLVTRHLEQARSFEVTFWRSFFTLLSLLVMLPAIQGRGVFGTIRRGGAARRYDFRGRAGTALRSTAMDFFGVLALLRAKHLGRCAKASGL